MNYKDYILEHFHYDSVNGGLFRDDRKNSLGSIDKDGYIILKIKGKQFKYHRIVWLVCNGEFPDGEIDHIDRNKNNNRIENLRDVSRKVNLENIPKIINKDTGEQGIYVDKSTKGLIAKYIVRRKNKCFRFRSLEEAIKKRDELWKI